MENLIESFSFDSSNAISALKKRYFPHDITKIELINDVWKIHITFNPSLINCDNCHGTLVTHGWVNSRLVEEPLYDQQVHLEIKKARFKCQQCGKTRTACFPTASEGARITKNLESYIFGNITRTESLTNFATSLGVTPKVVASLLKHHASKPKRFPLEASSIGIHQFAFKQQIFLVLTNLEKEIIQNHLAIQVGDISRHFQKLFDLITPDAVQRVTTPASISILRGIRSSCKTATIEVSNDSIYFLVADTIAKLLVNVSKQGKRGSVTISAAKKLAEMRKCSLIPEEINILRRNPSGELFDYKDELLANWEKSSHQDWVKVFRDWLHHLPSKWRPAFFNVQCFITEAEKLGASITNNPSYNNIENRITELQWFLQRAGTSFTNEMVDGLIWAIPIAPGNYVDSERSSSKRAYFIWKDEMNEIFKS